MEETIEELDDGKELHSLSVRLTRGQRLELRDDTGQVLRTHRPDSQPPEV